MLEHIWVCEQHLGREIEQHEVVHHLNGVRDDNRPENLAVLPKKMHDTKNNQFTLALRKRILDLEKELAAIKEGSPCPV